MDENLCVSCSYRLAVCGDECVKCCSYNWEWEMHAQATREAVARAASCGVDAATAERWLAAEEAILEREWAA